MRKNAAPMGRFALVAGLLLVVGVGGMNVARAADTAQRPWLGVYMQELTSELREGLGYDGPGGVIVSRVVRDGPAERAGLRRDDVIVRLNGRTVKTPSELTEIVQAERVGQRMSVQVFRDAALRNLDVTLGSRPRTEIEREYEYEAPQAPEAPEAPARPKQGEKRIIIRGPEDLEDVEGLQGLDKLRELDLTGNGAGLFGMGARGRLGVRVEPLSPALGEYFGLKDGKGALVLEVLKDRPAERAGLLAGDVITRVNDKAVTNGRDLVEALRGKEGKVALRVVRHNSPRTIEATLDKAGPTWVGSPEEPSSESPGVQKRIIVRTTDREDLRRELDQLKQEIEELRQRLDRRQGE